jgi:DNA-directed RNA polymerase specialized sigma24 family protein
MKKAPRRREDLIKEILAETSDRDREILTRFYSREQSPAVICSEMQISEDLVRRVRTEARAKYRKLQEDLASAAE